MDRAFSSGASGTPPSAPGSPSTGYATSGNPGTGTPATKPGAYWYHMVTEELRELIVAAGLTPDHTNTSQIAQAVQALIAAGAANDYKASVCAATTANIASLAGGAPNTLDGVTLVANDRILVKDQTTGSQNGIYYVSTLGTGANGTWTRATDADGVDELTSGAIVAVDQGSVNADSQWMLTTDGAIVIGTTSLTFLRKESGRLLRVTIFTASGTWNKGVGTNSVEVEVVAGGGAGGGTGTTGASQYSSGAGGSAGGYARKFISNVASPQTVTVGAGGSGVSGAAGNSGQSSSFGALVSATGGGGGQRSAASAGSTYSSPGASGTATGGDINISGGSGSPGWTGASITNGSGGMGGNNPLGFGAGPGLNSTGGAALGYGGGGGGTQNGPSIPAQAGGAGSGGIVIVREYA